MAKCNVGGGRGEINWWACFELLPLLHSSCVWIWLTHRRGAHQLSPARAQQFLDTSLETAFPDLAASTEWFSNILFLEFKVFDVITHLCPVWLISTHIRCHYRCVWRNPYRPPGQCWESFEEVQIHLGIKELLQERNEVMDCIHSTAVWVHCILLWGAVSHAVGLFFSQQGTMVCWHTGGKLDADEAVPCAAWSRSLNSFTPITFLFAATQSSGLSSTSHSHRVEDFCQKPA